MVRLNVYTDGSANNRADSRCGGWAYAVLLDKHLVKLGYNVELCTAVSSNIMELTAAIEALKGLNSLGNTHEATIHCDSQYVVRGVTEWREAWVRRGWMTAEGSPVSNRLLWKELFGLNDRFSIAAGLQWKWVRGHNGNFWNEAVDKLACYKTPAVVKHDIAKKLRENNASNPQR